MKITVDKQEYALDYNPAFSVKQIIELVTQAHAGVPNRITRIVLDGEDITIHLNHGVLSHPSTEFISLEFYTADPIDLAVDIITPLQLFLIQMKTEIESATEWSRNQRIHEAYGSMNRIDEGLILIAGKVEEVRKLLSLDFGVMVHNGKPVLDYYTRLTEAVTEIENAMEETDGLLVADFLELEIKVHLLDWMAILEEVEKKIEKRQFPETAKRK